MPKQKRAMPASPMPESGLPTTTHGPSEGKHACNLKEHVAIESGVERPSTSVPTAVTAAAAVNAASETVNVEVEVEESEQLPPKQKSRLRSLAEIVVHSLEQLSGRIASGLGMSPRQMDWYKNCWSQPVADRSHLSFFEPRRNGF